MSEEPKQKWTAEEYLAIERQKAVRREIWFDSKWSWLKSLSIAAAAGVVLGGLGFAADLELLAVLGGFLLMPLVLLLAFIPILHWKDRYVGDSSGLWGFFLCFETSSIFKIIYWFRHVIPDWRRSGRYFEIP